MGRLERLLVGGQRGVVGYFSVITRGVLSFREFLVGFSFGEYK